MKIQITKRQLKVLIGELVAYAKERDIDLSKFNPKPNDLLSFNEFLVDKKFDEVMEYIAKVEDFEYYQIDKIVFDKDAIMPISFSSLILEYEQYKKIPQTSLIYRYDKGNTNTKTQDHIEVYYGNSRLYAINIDGTKHDGSKARLGSKEIKFLKSIGFTPPPNGILEWIELDSEKDYVAHDFKLLFD